MIDNEEKSTVRYTISIPKELHESITLLATKHRRSINNEYLVMLEEILAQDERQIKLEALKKGMNTRFDKNQQQTTSTNEE